MWACGPAEKKNGKGWPGAFPAGFLGRLKIAFLQVYPKKRYEIAHVCAGRVPKTEGITIDIDIKNKPNILANAEDFAKPFLKRFKKVKWSIADPPYNPRRAKEYYNQKLLNKHKMLVEMSKITKIGGYIAILDQYSLNAYPKNLKKIAIIGVTSVPNPDVRVFTVWKKMCN